MSTIPFPCHNLNWLEPVQSCACSHNTFVFKCVSVLFFLEDIVSLETSFHAGSYNFFSLLLCNSPRAMRRGFKEDIRFRTVCFKNSHSVLISPVVSTCVSSYLLQEEISLMVGERSTDLWVYQDVIKRYLITMFLQQNNSICFASRTMVYPVSCSWPLTCQTCVPSHGLDMKSYQNYQLVISTMFVSLLHQNIIQEAYYHRLQDLQRVCGYLSLLVTGRMYLRTMNTNQWG